MIKDLIVSFKDNFKDKTSNPFLGTYVLVWLLRNWEVVYTLVNFDKGLKLVEKVAYLKSFFTKQTFIENLLTNIFWTFLVLILTYVLINLSRLIVNFSEKQVAPFVYKISDSKSIVLKEVYLTLRAERDELEVKLDKEREMRIKLESRIASLETEVVERASASVKSEIVSEQEQPEVVDQSIMIQRIVDKLQELDLIEEFKKSALRIKQKEEIEDSYKPRNTFLALGLWEFLSHGYSSGKKSYKLTDDGESVLKVVRFM
ncbi:MAG: hypothetical protein EOO15_09255 [Chitinophagaceae bacterium]|nr:MAG: hypothetical protein EOO15_09255 [Chitinophagaceae bacterium]